jgi:hypothetical protein
MTKFSPETIRTVHALLGEYLTSLAAHPLRGVSDHEAELSTIAGFCRRWWPIAEAERPDFRPHGIAMGALLFRAKYLCGKIDRN